MKVQDLPKGNIAEFKYTGLYKEAEAVLKGSSLCKNMTDEEISRILSNPCNRVKVYQRGSKIFQEADMPEKVYILLSGCITVAKDTLSGKRLMLTQIDEPGQMFGEVYVFMQRPSYDMYAEASEESAVFVMDGRMFFKEDGEQGAAGSGERVFHTLRNNLLIIFAEKAYFMNQKLRILGSTSIREKVVRYLIDRQGQDGRIKAGLMREEMADYLHIPRPSLSRELGKMRGEGILKLERREIIILDQKKLELYL